jgi:hypothetical protein
MPIALVLIALFSGCSALLPKESAATPLPASLDLRNTQLSDVSAVATDAAYLSGSAWKSISVRIIKRS